MFLSSPTYRHPAFAQGVREMATVAPGIAAWGLMTGVAMAKSGIPVFDLLVMGAVVFAGSAQLAALPLMLAGAPVWVILATAFCVNLRFVVFSVHMRPYLMHLSLRQRLAYGYFVGDLTYVLFAKRFPKPGATADERHMQMAYLAGNGGINWMAWTGSTLIGIMLANFIPAGWGLGFAGILALTGVVCSLASTRMRWLAAAMSGVAAVVTYALPLKLNMMASILASVGMCLLLERLRSFHPNGAGETH